MHAPSLLSPDEPAAFTVENRDGSSRFVFNCDHASCRVPKQLGDLGLSPLQLSSHIGWDIGAAAVARSLAAKLDATLILQNYSRLVIDCNRAPHALDSIASSSDEVHVPGNAAMSQMSISARRRDIFEPYHDALRAILEQRTRPHADVIVVAVHSFTPVFRGFARPWHIGLMYRDARFAHALLPILRENQSIVVGDNEPYAINDGIDFSIPHHCESRGILHAGIEIRQDLIADADGQQRWSTLLHDALAATLSVLTATR